jgi:histidinol-phosphate/aromatic aminotransferase/cobyric acid decarboxylase-like protein
MLETLEHTPLDNIFVIKSLSKSLGVPGIRLGYSYTSNPIWIAAQSDAMPIWNANSLAEFFLEIILKHRNSLEQSIHKTIDDRHTFATDLEKIPGVTVVPSGANFILAQFPLTAAQTTALCEALIQKENHYVKHIGHRFGAATQGCFRLAVRLPEENLHLVNLIRAHMHMA